MSDFPWEDGLLERKTEGDLRDLLKTLVAFANSVRPGHVAAILIGEKDNGTAQGVTNPDNIQKKVREECDKIYPAIVWRSQVYEKDSKYCVRVEIEYSGDTPHFGGSAWVRRGSETVKANDEVFQRLIDLRLGKVCELAKWLGKDVTVRWDFSTMPERSMHQHLIAQRWPVESTVKVVSVNNFWVTFERQDGGQASEPLNKIVINYDNQAACLQVTVQC
jgi:Putative DNA-binding domain